jgi:hypothetical protein
MEISVNLPYISNSDSLSPIDRSITVALLLPVYQNSKAYLRGRPKVTPYHLTAPRGDLYGNIVKFNFGNAFGIETSSLNDAIALNAILEGLINTNIVYLRNRHYPDLYSTEAFYKRTRVWDSIPGLIYRGYGDCKSLTAYRVAELRMMGLLAVPVFRFKPRANGAKDFHILIQTENGYEDPSRLLGMGADENAHFAQG